SSRGLWRLWLRPSFPPPRPSALGRQRRAAAAAAVVRGPAMLMRSRAPRRSTRGTRQLRVLMPRGLAGLARESGIGASAHAAAGRSEEHTSELQSRFDLVCRLLLE